jgi:hypothetical protein
MCTAYDSRHNVFLIGRNYNGPLLAYRYKQVPLKTEKKGRAADPELSASPNPFNPAVTLRLSGGRAGAVVFKVFDFSGRLVAILPCGQKESRVVWNASGMASGVYTVAAKNKGLLLRKKIVYSK